MSLSFDPENGTRRHPGNFETPDKVLAVVVKFRRVEKPWLCRGARPPASAIAFPGALLLFFSDGTLRLHAAHRAHVANVHETVCDQSAFFGFHRLNTTGTSNDGGFALWHSVPPLSALLSTRSAEEEVPARFVAHEKRLIGVV